MFKSISFAAVIILAAVPFAKASPVQLDFQQDWVLPEGSDYTESGFSYQNSSAYVESDEISLHDDSGGLLMSTFSSVGGSRFDVIDADINGYSRVYKTGNRKKPKDESKLDKWLFGRNQTYDNYGFYGYRDGVLVASLEGAINRSGQVLNFGEEWRDLDHLVTRLLVPDALNILFDTIRKRRTLFCNEWCAGFQIDRLGLNVHTPVAPVPLPASLPLLLAGVAGVAAVRLRRKSA